MRLGLIIFLSFSFVLGLHAAKSDFNTERVRLEKELRGTQDQLKKDKQAFRQAEIGYQNYESEYKAVRGYYVSESRYIIQQKAASAGVFERYNTAKTDLQTTTEKFKNLENQLEQLAALEEKASQKAKELLEQSKTGCPRAELASSAQSVKTPSALAVQAPKPTSATAPAQALLSRGQQQVALTSTSLVADDEAEAKENAATAIAKRAIAILNPILLTTEALTQKEYDRVKALMAKKKNGEELLSINFTDEDGYNLIMDGRGNLSYRNGEKGLVLRGFSLTKKDEKGNVQRYEAQGFSRAPSAAPDPAQLQTRLLAPNHEQKPKQASLNFSLLDLELELERVKQDLGDMNRALGWQKEKHRLANADCQKLREKITTFPSSYTLEDQQKIWSELFLQQNTCVSANSEVVRLADIIQELEREYEKLEEQIEEEQIEIEKEQVSDARPSQEAQRGKALTLNSGQPEAAPNANPAPNHEQQPQPQTPSIFSLSSLPWKAALGIGVVVLGIVYVIITQKNKAPAAI